MSMWNLPGVPRPTMVTPDEALPGRAAPVYAVPERHEVLGTPLLGPWPVVPEVLYLGMGCFWGVEKMFWELPGVVGTAAGYMGGFTPNPTYEETCTSRTGHAEIVMVAYDPRQVSTEDIMRVFWENHDPTQVLRQGNDIGSQYRSAVYWTSDDQKAVVEDSARRFSEALADVGLGQITTEIRPADGLTFYPAEDYHQQYLHKVPHGYNCHSATGVRLPVS